jgi:uncharacterized protein YoxC
LSSTQYGILILDVLVGVGALLAGIGILVGMLALAKTLARVQVTLDGVDQKLDTIAGPVTNTLANVEGATKSLQDSAGALSRTADLTRSAVSPAIVNIGATLGGITAGLRRLVTGKEAKARE